MNDLETRIRQFKQMAEADPTNELGHFSLGKCYLDAGQFEEAVSPLQKAIEINPTMSKAYQLLGEALSASGRDDEAIDIFTQGFKQAHARGDRMPRDVMAQRLEELGAEVPEMKEVTVSLGADTADQPAGPAVPGFNCSRCGRPHSQLPKLPFRGQLGQTIFDNVCMYCWREWIPMGTKVINELGLQLSTVSGQEAYDQHMIEFLQLDGR